MARYCTGSTEAWTELVESATERRTLSAIQSSKKSLRIWNAPNAGSERIVYPHMSALRPPPMDVGTHKIPHNLTGDIPPPDQHAPGAHGRPFLRTTPRGHEPFAARVRPIHHLPHGFEDRGDTHGGTSDEAIEDRNKVDFEELDEVFVAAVADECGLVPDGLEVDLGPGATHVRELLAVGEDGGEGLGDLEHVEESHYQGCEWGGDVTGDRYPQTRCPNRAPSSTLGSTNVLP